jgi:acyl-homoserine lactone acylase PvdQ
MAGWLSPAERRALDSFPEQIGPEDLVEHFKLSPADLRFALKHRGDSRLGVAVQLCALRWLGSVPDDLAAIPQPALLELCDQLEANAGDVDGYGVRGQTRTDQLAAARAHAGFRLLIVERPLRRDCSDERLSVSGSSSRPRAPLMEVDTHVCVVSQSSVISLRSVTSGVTVDGVVGDADPLLAVADA